MRGRACLLAFIVASTAVHLLASLPAPALVRTVLPGLLLLSGWLAHTVARRPRRLTAMLALSMALAGAWLTLERAHHRLADVLQPVNVDRVSRVELRVDSLVQATAAGLRFQGRVLRAHPEGVPRRINVFWPVEGWRGPYASQAGLPAGLPAVLPGQVWRMALILRPPGGLSNPGTGDAGDRAFAQGVRARGRVRGRPEYLRDASRDGLVPAIARLRHEVGLGLDKSLKDMPNAGVLKALAIGDQSAIAREDWDTFNRTGIVHLVSISGTHVSLVAGLGAWLVSALWRRARWRGRHLAERFPAQSAAALAALMLALAYSLMAGWGVPAQRSFLMLATLAIAHLCRWQPGPSRLLVLAAFVVVLMDPWALLSRGFWLSFGTVAILLLLAMGQGQGAGASRKARLRRTWGNILTAVRLQTLVSLALLPILAALVYELPLTSPLANMLAIPLVGLLATPAALLLAVAGMFAPASVFAGGLAWAADAVIAVVMRFSRILAQWEPGHPAVAAVPVAITGLALLGLVLALMPPGLPARRLAWLLLLPALCRPPARPEQGYWEAWVFDVGQATAVLVNTRRHSLLFDTGLRSSPEHDSGRDVLLPAMRALGVRRLDALVVSHADLDHVGGAHSLLSAMRVEQSFASFDLERWLARETLRLGSQATVPALPPARLPCRRGQQWRIDGVHFEMLWPARPDQVPLGAGSRERNDFSCVLSVRGRKHSLLLPGDIAAAQEQALVRRGLAPHSVLVAAHHGSASSSSAPFLAATQAHHVIASAGRWNRHGHPHAASLRRWRDAGAQVWRTDRHGALYVRSTAAGLDVDSRRVRRRRYWNPPIAP